MKKRRSLNLTIPILLVIALIASSCVYLMLGMDKVEVLKAKHNIEPLTVLTADMLTSEMVDKSYTPDGYIQYSDADAILGKVVKYGMVQDGYVTINNLYTEDEMAKLRMDEKDTVLFMIPITAEQSVGGNLDAGDKVNITTGYTTGVKAETGLDTAKKVITVLQNIEIHSKVEIEAELAGYIVKVTPSQVHDITFALEYGSKLYLSKVPVNYDDEKINETNEETFILDHEKSKSTNGIVINNKPKEEAEKKKEQIKEEDKEDQKQESEDDSKEQGESQS